MLLYNIQTIPFFCYQMGQLQYVDFIIRLVLALAQDLSKWLNNTTEVVRRNYHITTDSDTTASPVLYSHKQLWTFFLCFVRRKAFVEKIRAQPKLQAESLAVVVVTMATPEIRFLLPVFEFKNPLKWHR